METIRILLLVAFVVAVTSSDSGYYSMAHARHVIDNLWSRYNVSVGVDLVFALDRSGSVSRKMWMSTINFVKHVIDQFDVQANLTRVAVVSFGTSATIDLDDVSRTGSHLAIDRCSLYRRISDALNRFDPEGHTATGEALRKAYDILLQSRAGVKKAVVMVTDGRSNVGVAPMRPAVQIRSLSWSHNSSVHWDSEILGPEVEVYAIGVAAADMDELNVVASPLPDHVINLPSYESFELLSRSLHQDKQEDTWIDVSSQGWCPYTDCSSFGAAARCTCGQKTGQYACACGPGYQLHGLQCRACPKGYYQDRQAPLPCRPCPENTTTIDVRASRSSDCQPLPGYRRCSPSPPDVANGKLFAVAGSRQREVANTGEPCANGTITDGNSCHYECYDGYRLSGSPVMVCESSGYWRGTVPTCDATDCHTIDEVALSKSARVVNVTYINGTTTYGSKVEVTCPRGTVALGGSMWTCNRDAKWTVPVGFRCQDVHCSSLVNADSRVVTSHDQCRHSRVALGTECSTSCPDGYEHRGPSNFTCSYDGRTVWNPEESPSCHDVEPPKITCPPHLDVIIANWDDVSVMVPYDKEQPIVSDNSGLVTWRVLIGESVAVDRIFRVGNWPIVYEAVDGANNTVTCSRNIHVRAKTVEARYCPGDVTLHTNSASRKRVVTWSDPVFVDGNNATLSYHCTKKSGSEFSAGVTRIDCIPELQQSAASCVFTVNITDPPCLVPFADRPPLHGSYNCTHDNNAYPATCHVHCQSGYELHDPIPRPPYRCDWSGMWNMDRPWPECYRTFRPSVAYMENTIIAEINGSCSNLRSNIIDSFIGKMSKLLSTEQPHGMCNKGHRCWFKNTLVNCTSPTAGTQSDREFSLKFVIVGQLSDQSRSTITEQDQKEIVNNLSEISDAIWGSIDRGEFVWSVNDHDSVALSMTTGPLEFEAAVCAVGQVLNDFKSDSPACHSCPVGSYSSNITCIRCPHGFYQDQEASFECKPCPEGSNTTFTGARNISECKNPCPAGFYSQSTGYEPCKPCPVGSYQNETGSFSCSECPANYSTPQIATPYSASCIALCGVDTFSTTGLVPCQPCPVGTYQLNLGSTECHQCTFDINSKKATTYCPDLVTCEGFALGCNINTSQCVMHAGTPSCLCKAGFTGSLCTDNIDDCNGTICENGGTCIDDVNAYTCECPVGYEGNLCDLDIDECQSSPCLNGGSCLDGPASYNCICVAGFTGSNCQNDIDECLAMPCLNNGRCADMVNGFTCTCDPGFTGEMCDKEIDYCVTLRCQHGGHCVVGPDFNVSCSCLPGFAGDSCEDLVDFCKSSPCLNGGVCFTSFNRYTCSCPLGFSGDNCQLYTPVNFDLIFSKPSVTDYVIIQLRPTNLLAVTGCMWIRTEDTKNYGTIWSYAVESNWLSADDANVFTISDYGNIQLFINGYPASTNVSLNNGSWHHMCVTWDGRTGNWHLYVNGSVAASGDRLAGGTYIQGGGTFVLGQEQDVVGGGFNIQESFIGEMSQFVLHDYVMTPGEIAELAQPENGTMCRHSPGTVLSWTDVIQNIRGNVIVANQSRCLDVNECKSVPNVCGMNETCIDTVGSYECRPCYEELCNPGPLCHETDSNDPCTPNPCHNQGFCRRDRMNPGFGYSCDCSDGFTGPNCFDRVDEKDKNPKSCSAEMCQNGGECHVTEGQHRCVCVLPWTGFHCQVMSLVTCEVHPCANNGTCVPSTDGLGYKCLCPPPTLGSAPLGPNCELVGPCDLPDTCRPDAGVCQETVDNGHRCLCLPGFSGTRCENDLRPTRVTTTTISTTMKGGGFCRTVDCRNGGTCIDLPNNTFRCECRPDYKGVYCSTKRNTGTNTYHVVVTLEFEYDRLLQYNDTFKELFRQQVHRIYEKEIVSSNSKFLTNINSISKGSVKVDFNLEHTYYLDQSFSGSEALRLTMENELKKGQLGTFKASMEGFVFEPVTAVDGSSTQQDSGIQTILYAAIAILVAFIVIGLIIGFICLWRRYHQLQRQSTKQRLLPNGAPSSPSHVSNPMYGADYRTTQQQQQQQQARCRLSTQESIYCEPREVSPYATSEDSDKESSSSVCRGSRPSDWRLRQSMPLPPKPDDGPSPTAVSVTGNGNATNGTVAFRCSPPPPYFPGRPCGTSAPSSGGPQPPPRAHSYVNDEDADPCYFQPISDEEVQLISDGSRRPANGDQSQPPAENEYLVARPSVDLSPSTDGPGQFIEMTDLGRRVPADETQSPLGRQLAVEVVDDAEDEDDIDMVDGRAVLYAIRRPSLMDT